jgi:hypothetical protein
VRWQRLSLSCGLQVLLDFRQASEGLPSLIINAARCRALCCATVGYTTCLHSRNDGDSPRSSSRCAIEAGGRPWRSLLVRPIAQVNPHALFAACALRTLKVHGPAAVARSGGRPPRYAAILTLPTAKFNGRAQSHANRKAAEVTWVSVTDYEADTDKKG